MTAVADLPGAGLLPPELRRDVAELLLELPPAITDDRLLREARFDRGLAFPQLPAGDGGRGLDSALQAPVEAMFLASGCQDWRDRNVIGLGMAAPTISAHGSREQRARWLRRLFTGEEIWCQLFSEPGAGSDLAALATSARRDGDQWIVNGQKVWTTLGHVARWGLLLARTDPGVAKHSGLTFFCLDMHSPGVDVRPLRQLTGEAEFNEVYLTDVAVDEECRLGEVGAGWRVAMTTLMNERVSLGGSVTERGAGPIGQAVTLFEELTAQGRTSALDRDRLLRLWSQAEAARLTTLRAATARAAGEPGPEGSVAKLQMAESNKAVYEFCVDLMGLAGALVSSYAETRPDAAAVHGGTELPKAYLRSRANSIEGGTSEILRNILGERVLGLPAEPRVDKGRPWNEVPRS